MNELVEAMLAAVPADGSSIGNQSLLEHLKIQFPHLRDEFYWQTREALIDQGLLRAGKGRGGSVRRSDVELPPASAWVQFLRSYGPSSRNLAMFDEYVSRALAQAGVEPISLSTPLLEDMVRHIESKAPGSILIAGTAGDGKTYHCRSLWERIGGDPKAWAAKGNMKELPLADGRLAVFIKDLSEFNGEESDLPLRRLENSVLQGNDSEIVILAANHGQILDRLRDLGRRQERDHPLRKPLQERFLQAGPAPDRLAVFDLSRSTSRKTLDEVAMAVAGHPEWGNCKHCTLQSDGKVCPIDENRRRLLGESDSGQLSRRLGDLVEIARHNGLHLPIRDLLALCSNMILGCSDAKQAKDNLMTCADVAKIQEGATLAKLVSMPTSLAPISSRGGLLTVRSLRRCPVLGWVMSPPMLLMDCLSMARMIRDCKPTSAAWSRAIRSTEQRLPFAQPRTPIWKGTRGLVWKEGPPNF